MATLKYRVTLGEEERSALQKRIRSGHDSARVLMSARVLLKADEGVGETQIAQALNIHRRTVEKVRQRYCESGLERALHEKPRPGAQRKFDGKQEAQLIAVAYIDVTQQRTMPDFAHFMQQRDKRYAHAQVIRVVLDNLNTHGAKSFYEAFEPEEARRLSKRFEFHYTPKHGSWLNMAEIELAALNKVCLNRRIADAEILAREVAAYERDRNARNTPIEWRFTTRDARIKLKRLYPVALAG